jgi:hypothetical protein
MHAKMWASVRACVRLFLFQQAKYSVSATRNARVEIGRRSGGGSLLTAPDTFGTTLMLRNGKGFVTSRDEPSRGDKGAEIGLLSCGSTSPFIKEPTSNTLCILKGHATEMKKGSARPASRLAPAKSKEARKHINMLSVSPLGV